MATKEDSAVAGRQLEEKYFREKERELIERLKEKVAKEAARKGLSEEIGVSDEGILNTLQEMGYDREVVIVLHLFPLVAVAWADGDISPEERAKILEAARTWGVPDGSAADRKLRGWLEARPDAVTTDRALRIIRDILQFRGSEKQADYRANFLRLSEEVAAASGGVLGFGRKISAAERAVIERITRELSDRHQAAAARILKQS